MSHTVQGRGGVLDGGEITREDVSGEGGEPLVKTDIPQRLDRLPWSSWHMRIITALGTSWLLDGLEVTLVGSLSGILQSHAGLGLSDAQVTGRRPHIW